MKYAFVTAALVGSVFASQHKAHAGFHQRRHEYPVAPQADVCTVYTTVYVTPEHPAPHYPTATPETPKPSVPEVSKPAYPAVPQQSQPGYPVVPQQSQPAVPESTSCTEETPKPTGPAPVPQQSQPGYPAVPPQSQPAVPQQSQPGYPSVPQPSKPAVPQESKPAVPESTSCTEETPKPTGPAPVPQQSQPAYPAVPQPSQPAYPAVPQPPKESKPSQPETPKPNQPSYPAVPEQSKPATYPSGEKPTPSQGSDKPKPSAPAGGNGHIVTNGDKWAITYTPYAQSGQCKTAEEIASDIKKISDLGFTTIRSYSTDCGVFEHVVPECQKHGLKIIYGIFLEAGGKDGKGCFSQYADEQLQDIKNKAPKDSVAMVIVGNECMFNGNCKPEELASYIDHVRQELQGAGFPSSVAVTTTEPVNIWEEMGAALCDHIDVFVCQVQPYFTQSISADMAGDFAAQQLDQAAKVCPGAAGKGKYIGEIGWPSSGQANGKAIASVEDQKIAMKSIQEKVGSHACVFSFQDDTWKAAGAYGVEQHFGCVDALSS
ncbi:glycoside hydrolase family 17 protein [Curvularia clavata]|uniref:Probable beta-glucosidase btgE n=1 Tax=Curvularia clavata TaxID=95742 RepID=A0A9Q9DT55_CURCL|nr:glycoside hydrolase family 17 protein [Curvularia clavata]